MNFRYITTLTTCAVCLAGLAHGERVVIQDGKASLPVQSSTPLTLLHDSREGDIQIRSTETPEVRVAIDGMVRDDLPSFLEWDDNTRTVSLKLLGEAAEKDRTVYLPANSHIKLKTVDGSVRISGIRGNIELTAVEGDVGVSDAGGSLLVEAIDGNVHVSLGSGSESTPVFISTVDGDISIEFPADFSADISATTLDGNIHFDVPSTITLNKERQPGSGWALDRMRKLQFSVNKGGRSVQLNSVDGDLNIVSR